MEKVQYGYWLPPDISTHGAGIDGLINVLHWFMLVLFVGWGLYLVYCLFKFRERPGHKADLGHHSFPIPKYVEIGVVLVEVALLVFFSYPIWARYKSDFPPEDKSLHVHIIAEQFAWNIHYPGADGKFGRTKIELIDGTNPVGLDKEDPAAKDDVVTINQFNIPVNKPVIIDLSSKDVIHSFFLPVARVKQDAVPGITVPIWFEATKTGEFEIACAQLCGLGHYRMRGAFNVMTQDQWNSWMAEELKNMNADAGPQGIKLSGENS